VETTANRQTALKQSFSGVSWMLHTRPEVFGKREESKAAHSVVPSTMSETIPVGYAGFHGPQSHCIHLAYTE
jgi:hypothetical protein